MSAVGMLFIAAFASVIAFGLWTLSQFVYRQLTSPIRHLRGPKVTSWIYGNFPDFLRAETSKMTEEWFKLYGNTLRCGGFFNSNLLLTMDVGAINYVLTHNNDYQKPPPSRYILSQILDKGGVQGYNLTQFPFAYSGEQVSYSSKALSIVGRHIMNPAFGPTQIRGLTNIFIEKAIQLCDVLSSEIAKHPTGTTSGARIDVMTWLSKTTLDIIGLAGFNYKFDALTANGKSNELNIAFATMIENAQRQNILTALQARLPFLRIVPSETARGIRFARRTMSRIGKELLLSAKAAARASATENGEIEKNSLGGRDLLSLLVKANMATDIPESQRLSDEDVLAQVPTFLGAGHETTSTATTWALYAIAKAPEIQVKLREELLSVDTETPSMDELMALPYLDAVVRESLRVLPPIPGTVRMAMKDDVIPVEKPYTDKYGIVHNSIRISKGTMIIIPILAMNLSRESWGPDAHEFKPERWKNIPEAVSHIPGVWSHQMSFIAGPRACIGYRFSIVEMKALLFALVRAFEFELAVPVSEIGDKSRIVRWPVLRSDPKSKPQLPMFVKPYKHT